MRYFLNATSSRIRWSAAAAGYLLSIFGLFLMLAGPASGSPLKPPIVVGLLVGIQGLGDLSYNDMTYAGLVRARQAHGISILLEHTESDDAAIDAAMSRLLAKEAHIIVANGFYYSDVVKAYARRYPDRYFIIQDAGIDGYANVAAVTYKVEEGAFLVGALSAMMTRTGHCGFIGGVEIPIMQSFRRGYERGVHHVDPEMAVKVAFISKGPDLSGFNNPAEAFKRAMAFYTGGVDIIFAAAGVSGNGVIRAARKSGHFAIGVDSDQDHLAEGHVLTSMMKRLDVTTYEEVGQIIQGRFTAGIKSYGIEAGGVGLSPMKYTRHLVPERIHAGLETIRREIVAGTIVIAP